MFVGLCLKFQIANCIAMLIRYTNQKIALRDLRISAFDKESIPALLELCLHDVGIQIIVSFFENGDDLLVIQKGL